MKSKYSRRAILIMSLVMMTSLAWAQRYQGPPPQPSRQQITEMIQELSTDLDLSEKQTSQISKLYSDHFNQMKSRSSQRSGSKRPDHTAMQISRQEFEAQVRSLLSPDQTKAYDIFLKSHGPQSGQRPPKR